MLAALIIILIGLLGVMGVGVNILVATSIIDEFRHNTQWGAGYFVAGGFVTVATAWLSLLLFSEPKHSRLIITSVVAAAVFLLPVCIASFGKVRLAVRQFLRPLGW